MDIQTHKSETNWQSKGKKLGIHYYMTSIVLQYSNYS